MSERINDCGPAFPKATVVCANGSVIDVLSTGGMSLRDWFAGQALIAMHIHTALIETQLEDAEGANIIENARDAYKYADAMLKAREVLNAE